MCAWRGMQTENFTHPDALSSEHTPTSLRLPSGFAQLQRSVYAELQYAHVIDKRKMAAAHRPSTSLFKVSF